MIIKKRVVTDTVAQRGRKELTMDKMTMREFCEQVIATTEREDLKTYAQNEIAKLDARNAKRQETKSKTQVANEPIMADIRNYLLAQSEPKCANQIGVALGLTSNKVASLVAKIDGVVIGEMKHDKRKVKSYRLTNEKSE